MPDSTCLSHQWPIFNPFSYTDGDVLFLFLLDTSGKLPEPKSEMANDFLCLFQFIYFVNIF